ncbi:hypothetical protein CSPX01_02365, partial [Colletotrichum filicis]
TLSAVNSSVCISPKASRIQQRFHKRHSHAASYYQTKPLLHGMSSWLNCLLVLSGNLGISTSLRKLGLGTKSTHHVQLSHLWACSLLSPHLSTYPVYQPPSEAPSPAHSHAFRYCPFQEAGFKHGRVPAKKLGSKYLVIEES